jgi:hypothetical protein
MRFVCNGPGFEAAHFVSELAPEGDFEVHPCLSQGSLHYLSVAYLSSAPAPRGGVEVRLRENRPDLMGFVDYVIRLNGARARAFKGAGLLSRDRILVRTSDLRPFGLYPLGYRELTGTGFDFFPLGIKPSRQARRHKESPTGDDSLAMSSVRKGGEAARD